jgi:hypothetical protein
LLVGRVHADYVVARADEGIEEEKVCGDSAGGDDWETIISVLRDRREKRLIGMLGVQGRNISKGRGERF